MEDPGLETIHVPIYLPECIRPDTDLGQELSSLILALTERLAPKFGVLMAADLAHFCIIEMDADEGPAVVRKIGFIEQAPCGVSPELLG